MKERKVKKEWNLRQIGNMALIVSVFAIFLVGICFVRFSKAYVNAFIGNYTGIEEMLATMKGGANTDAAKRELLACQNDYDAWKEQHQGERVTLQTEDNIRLSGLLYDQGGKETVVYLHNIGSAAGEDFYYAPWYWEKGYNILMPDNRAHGESEGNCASYGVYEGKDVNQWLQLICEKYGEDSRIIVHGDILGAAAALMASADYPEQVAFTVAESPVVNLYDAAEYMMKNQFSSIPLFLWIGDWYSYKEYGFHLKDVDLTDAVQESDTPLLILCGSKDTVVDPENAVSIQKASGADCQILGIEDGTHGLLYAKHSDEIEQSIDHFIGEYINNQQQLVVE